ncbi:ABC transporter permease subunit [Saliphagus infecundisoli]|uniref:ABC transporter permease subunit n=1 Tax=Saliphagus infecundisoli TaxID=1849069 RepID=A0ABD5QJA0_9EURY|nr:ABC transporter permease subunit [Saliphagus infecundisoli]
MSWRALAYKDLHDASRSRTLWLLVALLIVVFGGYTVGHGYLGEETFPAFVAGLAGVVGVFLPVLSLLIGYKSVVHERTSGSLHLTLSFPHSRSDLVVGTLVGRSLVLLAPTLLALALAGVGGVVLYGTEGTVAYPLFLAASALYGLAFVGVAVGLSLSTTADRWITFGALGGYLLLVQLWDNLHSLTLLVLHRFEFAVLTDIPDWALLFRLIKPSESYYRLLRAGFDVSLAGRYVGDVPVYVGWWMALVILVGWIAVPLAVGYRRFRAADL